MLPRVTNSRSTQRICVVKVKGEGWKVITTEASYLKDYAD